MKFGLITGIRLTHIEIPGHGPVDTRPQPVLSVDFIKLDTSPTKDIN